MSGVTFLVPVHNPGTWLADTVASIVARGQESGAPFEVVLVEDRSAPAAVDGVLRAWPSAPIRRVPVHGAGAADALNAGVAAARFPLIAQVDQDVVLHPGWLTELLTCMDADQVAAVQGQYVTDAEATLLPRVMARDLEDRYSALVDDTDHVCTGNVLYQRDALLAIGGFDGRLGYGYDNDVSYRLSDAGYRLRFCAAAQSHHRWRDGLAGYLRQQYGFGYGRLDLVSKHRRRLAGDAVSPTPMMLHPVGLALALAAVAGWLMSGEPYSSAWLSIAGALVTLLVCERLVVGVRAALRFRDWVPLLFPVVHLLRDAAWVAAIVAWVVRRAAGVSMEPGHSMKSRRVDQEPAG